MTNPPLLSWSAAGLHCRRGRFFIDPRRKVDRALITHAHGDHIRPGCREYFCAARGLALLRRRLRTPARIQPVPYGRALELGGVRVSFHPAGHILGSAQVRIEADGEVWVVSGDYKRQPDPSCDPFEPLACDVFITEATFAAPRWRWGDPAAVIDEIAGWWERERDRGRAVALFAHVLGKTQRLLAELALRTSRRAWVPESTDPYCSLYREAGVRLLETQLLPRRRAVAWPRGELVLLPPGRMREGTSRRPGEVATALVSGWVLSSASPLGGRFDRGFALSDHCDWGGTLRTVEETGAKRVYVTHGEGEALLRELGERGREAYPIEALAE